MSLFLFRWWFHKAVGFQIWFGIRMGFFVSENFKYSPSYMIPSLIESEKQNSVNNILPLRGYLFFVIKLWKTKACSPYYFCWQWLMQYSILFLLAVTYAVFHTIFVGSDLCSVCYYFCWQWLMQCLLLFLLAVTYAVSVIIFVGSDLCSVWTTLASLGCILGGNKGCFQQF